MVSHELSEPTLYVSDLDGTLLGEDSQLSAVTVATLNRIIGELGGLFTVATARTPATVVPLMQQVHARLPFIVIGGSAMWNPVTMSYEHTRGIDDMTVNAVADVFDRRGAHPFIYRRHGKNLLHTHHYGPLSTQEERFIAERQHLPLKQFFLDDRDFRHSDDEALLIFSMNKYAVLKSIADDLRTSVPSCSVMVYHDIFDESEGYLEIFSAGTSKAAAIRDLARQLGAGRVVVPPTSASPWTMPSPRSSPSPARSSAPTLSTVSPAGSRQSCYTSHNSQIPHF